MQTERYGMFTTLRRALTFSFLLAAFAFTGCQSETKTSSTAAKPAATPVAARPTPTPPPPADNRPTIRIKTGVTANVTDAKGNVWLADMGSTDGQTIARPTLAIAKTDIQPIYQAERYSMTKYTIPVPNGKYTVKLHFAETYEGITGAGTGVFSYNVEGQAVNNFDVFQASGGFATALVKTYDVDITDGKVDITFTPNIENPEINGIEIIPR